MSKEIIDMRKEEIINACEKLYENNSFKDITINNIFSYVNIQLFSNKRRNFLSTFKKRI